MFLLQRDGYYHIEYIDESTGCKRRISTKTKQKSLALKFLSEFNKSKKPKIKAITFKQFEDEYVQHLSLSHSLKYIESVHLAFNKLTCHINNDADLIKINERFLELILTELYKTKPHAAHLYYRTLKAAFNKAIFWKYLDENPLKRIKLQRITGRHPVFMTKNDLIILLSAVQNKDLQDIYNAAFYTGMRLSEILNLSWTAINIDRQVLVVMNTDTFTTKSKKDRIIPMNEITLDIFKRRKLVAAKGMVFLKDGRKLRKEYVSKNFKRAVIKSGLNPLLHFHCLRHSFASNLIQMGVSLYLVKELLGHESITTTEIYSHLQKDDLVEAISKLN